MIELWTKDGCSLCIKAEAVLREKNIDYNYKKLDKDFKRIDAKNKFPEAITYPIFVLDDVFQGSYDQLVHHLSNRK